MQNQNDDLLIKDIQEETDFIQYVSKVALLKKHAVIILVKDIIGSWVGEDGYCALSDLGLKQLKDNWEQSSELWRPYVCCIVDGKRQYEKLGVTNDTINKQLKIYDYTVDLYSAPFLTGNEASMVIDNEEYCINKRGLNFIIFNRDGLVVDSVCFDTHLKNRPCHRIKHQVCKSVNPIEPSKLKCRNAGKIRHDLLLNTLIGDKTIKTLQSQLNKIKVRFFFWAEYDYWLTVQSLVEAFSSDERFDVLVVLPNTVLEKTIIIAGSSGVDIVLEKNYSIENDSPDIAVFNRGKYYRDHSSIKFKVLIEAGLVNGYINNDVDSIKKDITQNRDFDAILVEKNIYEAINGDNKWYHFGHPKFDIIYNSLLKKNDLPETWKKLKGKKVILWAFDHNIYLNTCTLDLYLKSFIQYVLKNKHIALIIRPHHRAIQELLLCKIWTNNDLKMMKIFCDKSENIIWDDNIHYGMAYSMANAVITDVNCGITVSALPLNIPIGITERFDGVKAVDQYPTINAAHYRISSLEKLYSFLEMIEKGEDPNKQKRKLVKEKYISNFDGKNGLRIKDFIFEKYNKIIDERKEK